MESTVMARPKAPAKASPKAKKATPSGGAPALSIRGSAEWREWVQRGTEHCRLDVAKAVDAALIEYFKAKGFTEAPPKR